MLLAEDAASSSGSSLISFLPIIAIVVLMYFLLIRPQSKRRRDAQAMQSQLAPGDEVQTVGGLFATVVALDNESITVEPAPGVRMKFARGAIARVVDKRPTEPADTTDSDASHTSSSDSGSDG